MNNKKSLKGKKILRISLIIITSIVALYFLVCLGLFLFEPANVICEDMTNQLSFTQYSLFDKSKNDKFYIQPVFVENISRIPKENEQVYVNDTLIFVAQPDTTYKQINEFVKKNDAVICGYIECINFYQIIFNKSMSYDELCLKCDELKNSTLVKAALLDCFENVQKTKDAQYDGYNSMIEAYKENEKDELLICEQSWQDILESINIDDAWQYKDSFQNINVGVLDSFVDSAHPDLEVANADEFSYGNIYDHDVYSEFVHGTHVSGIIGAKHDDKGIDGVCPTSSIYSYSVSNMSTSFWIASMCKLIKYDNAKVINVSWGHPEAVYISASMGDEKAIKYIADQAAIVEAVLTNLLNQGEEFLICCAAGNFNSEQLYRDFYGYFDYGKKPILDKIDFFHFFSNTEGKCDAEYGFWFQNIKNPEIKDRVIVVGACDYPRIAYDVRDYAITAYSNIGERVDIIAPGETYSTTPDNTYGIFWGTSMATPFVSGTAAMIFAVNPNFTGKQVKEILISSAEKDLTTDDSKYTYPLLNAGNAVKQAVENSAA